jgi:hypothetical protein
MGFRPVTVSEYLSNNMPLPSGSSPVVLTFDDSDPSQFRMHSDGSIDRDSAVGIWQDFAKEHPDFPVRASFYVLPPTPWGQGAFVVKKFVLLREWGCEIGSHTMTHSNLSKLSDDAAVREIGGSLKWLATLEVACQTIALPFGISPKNKSLLKRLTFDGTTYTLRGALLVGAGPAPSPNSLQIEPFRLPRIQAIEGDYGITYWLDRVAKGKVKPYVEP